MSFEQDLAAGVQVHTASSYARSLSNVANHLCTSCPLSMRVLKVFLGGFMPAHVSS